MLLAPSSLLAVTTQPTNWVALLGVLAFFVAFLVLLACWEWVERKSRAKQLHELARGLKGGLAVAPDHRGAKFADARASGALDGHDVLLRFEYRNTGKRRFNVAILEVSVQNPAASFDVAEASVLDRLGRWLGLSGDAQGDDDLVLRAGSGDARRLIQAGAVRAALRAVLALHDVASVSLQGSTLRVEQWNPRLDARALRELMDAAVALARRCDRVPVKVARELTVRFAWTDGGTDARCPYCRDGLDPEAEAIAGCGRCQTLHHRECLSEAGGCTVFGCGAERSPAPVKV